MEGWKKMAVAITHLATDGFWGNADLVDEFIARKLKTGATSLVLGAGASHGFNLPDWETLVANLRAQCGVAPPTKMIRPEEEADSLLRSQFRGDRIAFAEAVWDALYESTKRDAAFLLKSDLLQSISAFLTNSLRGRACSVITFNFDDIVENYLRLLGFIVKSETSVPAWAGTADAVIYHPHGLLPMLDRGGRTKIVFTESDFDQVVGRESDAWNRVMNSILSSTFPVFIGLSGNDARLRSILLQIKEIHPATKMDSSLYWAVRPTRISEDKNLVDRWRDLGVAPRYLDGYADIPAWLLGICQKAANLK